MSQEQTLKDIDRWSIDKLDQWCEDSMMRFRIVDAEYADALSRVVGSLMVTMAGLIACSTEMPPEVAGHTLAKMIRVIRERNP